MYNADISGQYLVQCPDYRIHYHYHTTITLPKYNLLHTSQASYEEAPTNMTKKRCLPVLQVLFNQRTLLANKEKKASTQVT
jgi:hypothetical protein